MILDHVQAIFKQLQSQQLLLNRYEKQRTGAINFVDQCSQTDDPVKRAVQDDADGNIKKKAKIDDAPRISFIPIVMSTAAGKALPSNAESGPVTSSVTLDQTILEDE